jgi:hypothetical protein
MVGVHGEADGARCRTLLRKRRTMPLTYSVIVCAYNEAAYLLSCLHSVLAQTRPPDEVVVVNNASSDATREVAARVSDIRIVDEPRKGLVRARETARLHSSGDVLVYLMPIAVRPCAGSSASRGNSSAVRRSPSRVAIAFTTGISSDGPLSGCTTSALHPRPTSSCRMCADSALFSRVGISRCAATRWSGSAGSIRRSSSTARIRTLLAVRFPHPYNVE